MELRQLRYFVAVAEELNFTRAAGRCHTSQQNLSRQVQALEDELGVTLLERTPRGCLLTEPGRVLLEEARQTLAQMERTVRRVKEGPPGARAVRVGVHYPEYAHLPPVAPLLAAFRQRCPGVRLDVTHRPSNELTRALERGELDLGVLHTVAGQAGSADLFTLPLLREQVFVAFSPDHPLAPLDEVPLHVLGDRPVLIAERATFPEVYDHLLAGCRAGGWVPGQVLTGTASLAIDTGVVLLQTVVGLVAGSVVGHLRALGLVCRPVQDDWTFFHVTLAVAHRADGEAAAQDFLALARELGPSGEGG